MNQKFPKTERLYQKKAIEQLFNRQCSKSFLQFPLKFVYLHVAKGSISGVPRVLISVSKRNFKRAHDRNLLKRRIKEAYRTQKIGFTKGIDLAFVYIAKESLPYARIKEAISKGLQQILERESK